MRIRWAAPLVLLVATWSAWTASACGSFSEADTPIDDRTDAAPTEGGGGEGGSGEAGGGGEAGAGPGRIYVVAGEGFDTPADGGVSPYTDAVLFATQQAGGALGPWTATERNATLHGNATVATAAGLLNLGGELQSLADPVGSATAVTSRALVSSTGAVGEWLSTTPLTTKRYFHAAVVVNDYVVVIGGSTIAMPPLATVQTARIAADGSLTGGWKDVAPLPQGRTRVAAATDGKHIFVVGGLGDASSCTFDVLVGIIDGNGDIPSWASTGVQYSYRSAAAVVFEHKLYAIGGYRCSPGGVSRAVQIADINADGTLAAFKPGVELLAVRWNHRAVALGPHLYVLGGNDGTVHRSEVFRADLDGSGAYDSWKIDGPLPEPRALFGAAAR